MNKMSAKIRGIQILLNLSDKVVKAINDPSFHRDTFLNEYIELSEEEYAKLLLEE